MNLETTLERFYQNSLLRKLFIPLCSLSLLTAPLFYTPLQAKSPVYQKTSKPKKAKKPQVLILPPKLAKLVPQTDFPLDNQLEAYLTNFYSKKILTPSDKLSLVVYDLKQDKPLAVLQSKDQPPRHMAASLIKPFVMLAAYDKLQKNKTCNPHIEEKIEKMIVYSNNPATNELIDFVGGLEAVNKTLRKYGFSHTFLVETIPDKGKTYKNKTSAYDLTDFFLRLYHKKLISPEYSEAMLKYLSLNIHNKIETPKLKQNKIKVADKTGFVRGLNGDSGIVYFKDRPYLLTIIIENKTVGKGREFWQWKANTEAVITSLSDGIFEYVRKYSSEKLKTINPPSLVYSRLGNKSPEPDTRRR